MKNEMSIIERALEKLGRQRNFAGEIPDSPLDHGRTGDSFPLLEDIDQQPALRDEPDIEMIADVGNGGAGPEKKSSDVVTIDLRKLDSLGFITPKTANLHLFEQYRHIKMQVLSDDLKRRSASNANIIVITSAVPGEGKTYSSINLALSIAYEYNHTVLFIDGDVHKKTSSRILEINERPGLLDYLTGEKTELADLLLSTNIEKFTVLPNGRFHDRATELYNSKRMQLLMQELSKRYSDRLIIIDTPPLLQDTSASAIARIAGNIIMVVEAEKTPRHYVEESLRRINRDKLLGIILNKSNQRHDSEYGYYSSYGRSNAVAS